MKNFNITYLDGIEEGVKADSLCAAINRAKLSNNREMIKVECIDKQIIRHQIKQVNEAFRDMGQKYWDSLTEMQEMILSILTMYSFEAPESFNLSGPEGDARAVNIGRRMFLCVTWYQLSSKRYEFVGYVS